MIAIADVPLVRLSLHALLSSVSERVPAPWADSGPAVSDTRVDIDPHSAGPRSGVALVLTVVELLRQLMERQAIRRFDSGELTEEQDGATSGPR